MEVGVTSILLNWKLWRWTSTFTLRVSSLLFSFLPFVWGVASSVFELKSYVDDYSGLFTLKAQPYSVLQALPLIGPSWPTEFLVWIPTSLTLLSVWDSRFSYTSLPHLCCIFGPFQDAPRPLMFSFVLLRLQGWNLWILVALEMWTPQGKTLPLGFAQPSGCSMRWAHCRQTS